jgi:hypothetical protein
MPKGSGGVDRPALKEKAGPLSESPPQQKGIESRLMGTPKKPAQRE